MDECIPKNNDDNNIYINNQNKKDNKMTEYREKAELNQHLLKQEHLVFDAKVIFHATPASKLHISDIPNVAVLKTEGKTADADAIEVYTSNPSLVDATGVLEILIDEQVEKIYSVSVTPDVGTATATAALSAGNRIIIEIDSNQNLSTTSVNFKVDIVYKLK